MKGEKEDNREGKKKEVRIGEGGGEVRVGEGERLERMAGSDEE